MVLTEEDYSEFNTDKRYLSAKLLTYFAEHPLLFVGYGIEDQNIKNVLYDISRMFRPEMTLSPNIYILQWDESQDGASYPPRERVLDVGGGVNVRVKSITSSSFEWVFKAFGANGSLSKVDLKALRSLMARTVNLIRSDIPAKNVEVNYETLEHAISSGTSFANLFGVTTLNNPGAANANHPYTSQMLAEQLGLKHWTETNKLMDSVREVKQFDMKGSDNLYHVRIKTGKKETSGVRKYSDVAVELLKKVKQGMDYEIAQGCLIKI
jgi:SIR2-like domain